MSQKIGKPRIVVKSASIHMTRYFDWLITGLGILSELGEIEPVKFDLEPVNRVLASNAPLRWALRRAMPRTFSELNQRSQYLRGEFWLADRKVRFVFDISDDPVWLDVGQLEDTDIYFKAQYYSNFPGDFAFTTKLKRNPSKAVVALQDKVKPAMLGRPLARSLDWRANLRVLKNGRRSGVSKNQRRSLLTLAGSGKVKYKSRRTSAADTSIPMQSAAKS